MKLDKETRKTGGKKVVEDTIVVDLKAIKNLDDIHFAVVRSQLKAVGRQHGLLLLLYLGLDEFYQVV
jgi:hypothetical protein